MSDYPGARRRRDDDEGESYFISMSDLMAGVLFLFIIMLTNFALQIRSAPTADASRAAKTAAAAKARAEALKLEQAKAATQRSAPAAAPPPDARLAALLAMADYLKARRVEVQVDVAAGALRFPNSSLFQGTAVSPVGRQTLSALADAMRQVLPCFAATALPKPPACPTGVGKIGAVFVEGHSDTGSPSDWPVSVAQGAVAFQSLIAAQPDLQKLQNGAGGPAILSVSGYGPTRPVVPGDRNANSRLDLRLVLSAS